MGEWAATRMESLLWEEKLDRIKTHFQSELTDTNNQGDPLDLIRVHPELTGTRL